MALGLPLITLDQLRPPSLAPEQASGSARAELDQALAITLAKAAAERDKAVSDAVRRHPSPLMPLDDPSS